MKHYMVLLLLGIACLGFPVHLIADEQVSNDQQTTIEKITQIGGVVEQDLDQPGQPVIGVDLSRCNLLIDNDLVVLEDLHQLRSLDLSSCPQISDAALVHVKGLLRLESLDLSYCANVGDEGLKYLAGLEQLKSLDFTCTKVSGKGLVHLAGLKKLRALSLSGCRPMKENGLVHLRDLKELRILLLEHLNLQDGDMENLQGLSQLETLSLYHNLMLREGVKQLSNLPRLQNLNLIYTNVTHAELECFTKHSTLRALRLGSFELTDEDLVPLRAMNQLEDLVLFDSKIGTTGIANLAELENLQKLYISNCPRVTSHSIRQLQGLTRLKELTVDSPEVHAASLKDFTQLEKLHIRELLLGEAVHLQGLTQLKEISVGGQQLGGYSDLQTYDRHPYSMGPMFTNTMLKQYDDVGLLRKFRHIIGNGSISDAGMELIQNVDQLEVLYFVFITDYGMSCLSSLDHLRDFRFFALYVTDDGMQYLSQLKSLESLEVKGGLLLTDAGIKPIGELTHLKQLTIEQSQLTDEGLKYLKGLEQLEQLRIIEAQLTDAGVEHLKELRHLRNIAIARSGLTDAGKERLKELLPRCVISVN